MKELARRGNGSSRADRNPVVDDQAHVEPIAGMSAASTGREDRIAQLYRRYAPQIAAYALRRAAPDESADVVSETFLVAWRRSDDIPPEPHTLPWLYGVARRVLANQRRSSRRRGRLRERLAEQFTELHTPPVAIEDLDRLDRLGRAMGELSADDAELLRLVAWEGLSPTQIAGVFEIEPTTARQRIHRARLRLRRALDDGEPSGDSTAGALPTPRALGRPRRPEVHRS